MAAGAGDREYLVLVTAAILDSAGVDGKAGRLPGAKQRGLVALFGLLQLMVDDTYGALGLADAQWSPKSRNVATPTLRSRPLLENPYRDPPTAQPRQPVEREPYSNTPDFGGQSRTPEPGRRVRLAKIKDPNPFLGKGDVKVEDWIFDMQQKMKVNYTEFPDESVALAYAASLTTGDARSLIRDRLIEGSVGQIETAAQLFRILQRAYGVSKETEISKLLL
ncbi:hypothetical protein B2J93_8094 [Marssonina coronariae]|uniref:Uncharacterized protein n=1 Tax=Diplocarpon coronariae TaxID=2795749 RepID=A0A218ZC73_9HELO|nr:hypothetical protein B2J93_8094 [Marssonina coronariae]